MSAEWKKNISTINHYYHIIYLTIWFPSCINCGMLSCSNRSSLSLLCKFNWRIFPVTWWFNTLSYFDCCQQWIKSLSSSLISEKIVSLHYTQGHRGRDRMVVGFTNTCAIGAITTKVVSSNTVQGEVYLIQHYVIKFVSDLAEILCYHQTKPTLHTYTAYRHNKQIFHLQKELKIIHL
jgi:hypothetical protein